MHVCPAVTKYINAYRSALTELCYEKGTHVDWQSPSSVVEGRLPEETAQVTDFANLMFLSCCVHCSF